MKIIEVTATLNNTFRPVTLRVSKAPDPDRPCIGCALHNQRDCPDDCEDLLEDGMQFVEIHGERRA